MNILLVTEVFPPKCGGVGWFVFYLAKALKKTGHSVDIVTVFGDANDYGGVSVHRLNPVSKETAHRSLRNFLKRYLAKHKISVINAHNAIPIRASVDLGIPVVGSVHDYWPVCFKGTLYRAYSKQNCHEPGFMNCGRCIFFENSALVKLLSPAITPYMRYRTAKGLEALKKCAAITFLSKAHQEILAPFVQGVPHEIVYNICAPDVDYKKVPIKKFVRHTAVFLGKFNLNKGAPLVLEIAKKVPELDFIMIGGNKEELGKPLPDNVTIIPYLENSEVMTYLKSCDVFLAPALWQEPFGRIVVEAMAMGTVPIVSNRGGMSSDIVQDGQNGLVVEPNPESFANAIRELLADKKRHDALKKAAREDFLKRFNEKASLAQFTAVFEKVSLSASCGR